MSIRQEKNKKPGVSYALGHLGKAGQGEGQVGAKDEIELPVVDVTHPAFALAPTDAELETLRTRVDVHGTLAD